MRGPRRSQRGRRSPSRGRRAGPRSLRRPPRAVHATAPFDPPTAGSPPAKSDSRRSCAARAIDSTAWPSASGRDVVVQAASVGLRAHVLQRCLDAGAGHEHGVAGLGQLAAGAHVTDAPNCSSITAPTGPLPRSPSPAQSFGFAPLPFAASTLLAGPLDLVRCGAERTPPSLALCGSSGASASPPPGSRLGRRRRRLRRVGDRRSLGRRHPVRLRSSRPGLVERPAEPSARAWLVVGCGFSSGVDAARTLELDQGSDRAVDAWCPCRNGSCFSGGEVDGLGDVASGLIATLANAHPSTVQLHDFLSTGSATAFGRADAAGTRRTRSGPRPGRSPKPRAPR